MNKMQMELLGTPPKLMLTIKLLIGLLFFFFPVNQIRDTIFLKISLGRRLRRIVKFFEM